MGQNLKFVYDGQLREFAEADPTRTVLRWLREEEARTGTKEGCAEGDCGACTVVLGELRDGAMHYQAVNACILFLPSLHGKWLITVEDLTRFNGGQLHPVQKQLVQTNGSQCGFCTPGFVMSMFAMFRKGGARPDRQGIDDALAGNLCRCTGYGPIIDAAGAMYDDSEAPAFAVEEKDVIAMLASLESDETVEVSEGGRRNFAPATVDAMAALVEAHPDATIVAGATDVGLWVTKMHKRLETVIYTGRVKELLEINEADGFIDIGAAVSHTDAWDLIGRHYPDFGELIRRLGSTQVRNAGTIGGNIANGSPIGDTPPALIAADARLVLRKGAKRREIALEDYFIDYGKQDLAPGEFVELVRLPLPAADSKYRCYKISKRFDQDISASCGAFRVTLDGNVVQDIRIAFGGMAATPKRAALAEAALLGKPWTEAVVEDAMKALDQDYTPLTDMRASADYRSLVSRNLLKKFYFETSGAGTETRLVGDRSLAHA